MDNEKFEKDMAVFSFKQHQNVLAYLLQLKAKGWTTEDAQNWIKEEKIKIEEKRSKLTMTPLIKNCPECQSLMQLFPVNFSLGTQTGDSSDKSVWFCPKCGESIYNKEDIQTILKRLASEGGK